MKISFYALAYVAISSMLGAEAGKVRENSHHYQFSSIILLQDLSHGILQKHTLGAHGGKRWY